MTFNSTRFDYDLNCFGSVLFAQSLTFEAMCDSLTVTMTDKGDGAGSGKQLESELDFDPVELAAAGAIDIETGNKLEAKLTASLPIVATEAAAGVSACGDLYEVSVSEEPAAAQAATSSTTSFLPSPNSAVAGPTAAATSASSHDLPQPAASSPQAVRTGTVAKESGERSRRVAPTATSSTRVLHGLSSQINEHTKTFGSFCIAYRVDQDSFTAKCPYHSGYHTTGSLRCTKTKKVPQNNGKSPGENREAVARCLMAWCLAGLEIPEQGPGQQRKKSLLTLKNEHQAQAGCGGGKGGQERSGTGSFSVS